MKNIYTTNVVLHVLYIAEPGVIVKEWSYEEHKILTCYADYDAIEWVWSLNDTNIEDTDDIVIFDNITMRQSVLLIRNSTDYNGQYTCNAIGIDVEESAFITLPS